MARIGRYEVADSALGSGAQGSVYAGVDVDSQREVALKSLSPGDWATHELSVMRELKQQSRSPFIIATVDEFDHGSRKYLVMERGGKPLGEIDRCTPRPRNVAVQIAMNVVRAMQELHRLGYLHLDLHPKQVLVRGDDPKTTRLIDYTFAAKRDAHGQWRGAIVPGVPQFYPPEKILGAPADSTYDLYMAAGIAYYLLTGSAPFSSAGEAGLAERRRGPDMTRVNDPQLAAVLSKALAYAPEQRYRSSQALLDALEPFAS
jgi:eukaryotic-like serine/threonine-protein kinase